MNLIYGDSAHYLPRKLFTFIEWFEISPIAATWIFIAATAYLVTKFLATLLVLYKAPCWMNSPFVQGLITMLTTAFLCAIIWIPSNRIWTYLVLEVFHVDTGRSLLLLPAGSMAIATEFLIFALNADNIMKALRRAFGGPIDKKNQAERKAERKRKKEEKRAAEKKAKREKTKKKSSSPRRFSRTQVIPLSEDLLKRTDSGKVYDMRTAVELTESFSVHSLDSDTLIVDSNVNANWHSTQLEEELPAKTPTVTVTGSTPITASVPSGTGTVPSGTGTGTGTASGTASGTAPYGGSGSAPGTAGYSGSGAAAGYSGSAGYSK